MRKTDKLKLKMPEPSDNANIEDLNENAVILDQNIADLQSYSATKTELQKVSTEVKAVKDNAVDIKSFEQKLDKTDNIRAPLFFDSGTATKEIVLEWDKNQSGEVVNGTTLKIKINYDLEKDAKIRINFGTTNMLLPIVNSDSESDTEDIKAGSIIVVIYDRAKNSFILQGKGGGYAKVDYKFDYEPVKKYQGNISFLSETKEGLGATTVGDHALFAGGGGRGLGYVNAVDAYNSNLVHSRVNDLSTERSKCAATTVDNYALFAGGYYGSGNSSVDAYNSNLTHSTPTALSVARYDLSATTVGSYALFAGGGRNNAYVNTVDAYNNNLTRGIPTALSVARKDLAATTIGDYALFGGGGKNNGGGFDAVDAYNNKLVHGTSTVLSKARKGLAATTIGNYALFAGGSIEYGTSGFNTIDAYNNNLVRNTSITLHTYRYYLAATTVGDYALFAGGYGSGGIYSVVEAYNRNLVHSFLEDLSEIRMKLAAATIGDYALFAGGRCYNYETNEYDYSDIVEAYLFTELKDFNLSATKGSKYKFKENAQEQTMATNGILNIKIPNQGYIKHKKGSVII